MSVLDEPLKTIAMQRVERLFDRPLEELLRDWYEQGDSARDMAERIAAQGYSVSAMTVLNWIKSLSGRRTLIFPSSKHG